MWPATSGQETGELHVGANRQQLRVTVELERSLMPGAHLDLGDSGIAVGSGGQGLLALLVGALDPPGDPDREGMGVDEDEAVGAEVQRANGGVRVLRELGRRAATRRSGRACTIASEEERNESRQEEDTTHGNHQEELTPALRTPASA